MSLVVPLKLVLVVQESEEDDGFLQRKLDLVVGFLTRQLRRYEASTSLQLWCPSSDARQYTTTKIQVLGDSR